MRGDGEPAERLYGKGGGDGRGMDVLLKWLWGWQGLMQREGQAHSPTKREWDSADAKPYKHTHTLALRKVRGIVRMRNRRSVHKASVGGRERGGGAGGEAGGLQEKGGWSRGGR